MKYITFIFSFFAILCLQTNAKSQTIEFEIQEKLNFDQYTVLIEQNKHDPSMMSPDRRISIQHQGKTVWQEIGGAWDIIKNINDITGNGQPNLILEHYSGGAHCCASHFIFELGENFKLIDEIGHGHFEGRYYNFPLHEKKTIFVSVEGTFVYWNAPYVYSPMPILFMTFQDGKFRPDIDLMRSHTVDSPPKFIELCHTMSDKKHPCNREKWKAKHTDPEILQEIAKNFSTEKQPSPYIWNVMLDMIYRGHADDAVNFMNNVWPENITGKSKFFDEFKAQLESSPHIELIKRLNEHSSFFK